MADSLSPTGSALVEPSERVSKYRTVPDQTATTMPSCVPYIVGNEAAERFSFYGMRTILTVFMTTYLMNASGVLAVMPEHEALGWFHQFVGAIYFIPLFGGILADGILGRYRTIFWFSIVYCFGHLALALNDTRLGLFIGLALIALGGGAIKSSVSANVGDQFGAGNKHLLSRAYGWFYMSINIGSTFSTWLCPILLNDKRFGSHFAFGLPGVLMFVATVIFWMGRKKYVHVPPAGFRFVKEAFSREGLSAIGRLAIVYAFVALFWALWDQSSGGEWTLQAKNLDLHFLGIEWHPEQVQIFNPILIVTLAPLFNYWLYPAISKVFPLTPLRKIGIGLFLTASSFAVIWWLQVLIDTGAKPNVGWQLPAYILLTAGEVMVSITGLEFSYTQAPKTMKSLVMGIWLLAVWLGNEFDTLLNFLFPILQRVGLNLEGAAYFRFFTFLMLAAAILFIPFAKFYRGKTYIEGAEAVIE